ncbi:MAG: tail fiber domain-containing protein, partial [Hyphomicrobium sp.]
HHHGGHHHGGHHRSDIRLKEDIVPLARLDNGLELYRFRYQGSDRTAYVGVMAQEVEKFEPSAVSRDRDGYLMVDYDRLGLRFMTWAEWLRTTTSGHPGGSTSTN